MCFIVAVLDRQAEHVATSGERSADMQINAVPRNEPRMLAKPADDDHEQDSNEALVDVEDSVSALPRKGSAAARRRRRNRTTIPRRREAWSASSRMPISSAAMSMSRIAIQMRPMRPRTRFFAISANTITSVSANRYLVEGVARGLVTSGLSEAERVEQPARLHDAEQRARRHFDRAVGIVIEQPGHRTKSHCRKNCAASVAIAR